MGWVFALLLLVGGGSAWWWQERRFARNCQHAREILLDLIAGREPQTFVFPGGGRFGQLSEQLEQLANEQDRLRRWRSREEANLQTILASMAEGVLVVDEQHVVRLVNPSLLKILGLNFSPVGQSVLHAVQNASFEELVAAVLQTGEPQQADITVNGNRPPRHLSLAATQMHDVSGQPAVVLIVHDVTRLKQLEEVRREFVSNVSHELRTPLAIFQGHLENLLDTPDLPPAELAAVLEVLQRHSTRLNLLVEDLLILARLESRSDALKLEPIAAADFLRRMASDWKLRSKEKKITISVEVAPELTTFFADRFRMEQVFNNLIDNAVKYSERGDRVSLVARKTTEQIELSVEDNGPGVASSDLPHIFERFYRVDKARSRGQGGTGLGLSIVKHIVQSHGGAVGAESTYGKGTRIILRLPVERDRLRAQPGSEMEQPVNAGEHEPETSFA